MATKVNQKTGVDQPLAEPPKNEPDAELAALKKSANAFHLAILRSDSQEALEENLSNYAAALDRLKFWDLKKNKY